MKITFNFRADVVTDLIIIKKYSGNKLTFQQIIISLIKEMREKIEFEKLNPKKQQ